jgi:acyl dehydratase
MTTYLDTPADLISLVGPRLGTTDWIDVTQQHIDRFAEVTGYHRWMPNGSAATAGPFTAVVMQSYLALSLTPMAISEVLTINSHQAALNYGFNRVRFLSPARVGSRIQATVSVKSAHRKGIGLLLIFAVDFKTEDTSESACEADVIALYP